MSWVVWRQHSREAALVSGVAVMMMAFLVFEWTQMSAASSQLGLKSCQAGLVGTTCGDAINSFTEQFFSMSVIVRYLLTALPALLGVFIAAPLIAGEVEHGTHMFIWTQSISRMRWFGIKLLLVGGFTLLTAGALATFVTWWHQPLDLISSDGAWTFFDEAGPAYVSYALFSLSLGIAAGAAIQRTVPAMAATLSIFVAVRVAVYLWRPWFLPPLTVHLPAPTATLSGALQISVPGGGLQTVVMYQPADRFWTFQAIESGIFVLLAVLLVGISRWLLRHRVH